MVLCTLKHTSSFPIRSDKLFFFSLSSLPSLLSSITLCSMFSLLSLRPIPLFFFCSIVDTRFLSSARYNTIYIFNLVSPMSLCSVYCLFITFLHSLSLNASSLCMPAFLNFSTPVPQHLSIYFNFVANKVVVCPKVIFFFHWMLFMPLHFLFTSFIYCYDPSLVPVPELFWCSISSLLSIIFIWFPFFYTSTTFVFFVSICMLCSFVRLYWKQASQEPCIWFWFGNRPINSVMSLQWSYANVL